MSKVLVLYYSTYGHIEKLADAVAAGARETGAAVDIKRVPETAPEAVAKAAHFKLDQKALILHDADAIIRSTRLPHDLDLDAARAALAPRRASAAISR